MNDGARCSAPTLTGAVPEIDIRPAARSWASMINTRWASHGMRAQTRRFREQLGLPTDQPIVTTGHQPTMWHPGILSKYFAADSAARRVSGHVVWLVADQDAVDPFLVRLPVLDASGSLTTSQLRLGLAPLAGHAVSMLPASDADPLLNRTLALDSMSGGIERIVNAFKTHRDAPNAAVQAGEATADLLGDLGLKGQLLYATRLNTTDLFASLVEQIREDPDRFVLTYNAAVAIKPHAGVSMLDYSEINHRHELPLWRIRPDEPRQRVFEEDLDSVPISELAPRALLMTALLRLAGCELFIHGAGGAEYDWITEEWIRNWLGVEIAPMSLTSATLRLPLETSAPTSQGVDRAVWAAQHARHDPALLGDHESAEIKQAFVDRIRSMRDAGENPTAVFQEMQQLLRSYRKKNETSLQGLEADAAEVARRAGERAIAQDRTWAFALHEQASLKMLRDAIDRTFD